MKEAVQVKEAAPSLRTDLMALTKARLTFLVLVTTFVGFCLASKGGIDWIQLIHVMLGTALVAAGASAFNQIMEIEPDAQMKRTRERPLPSGRMQLKTAVWLAVASSTLGLVHLGIFVDGEAAAFAALTLFVYAGLYTPLKQTSSTCTLVGAVSGALPPLIGWVGAGGKMDWGALALFSILFFWQLPHFISINWIYREEYERAGFAMWCNGDVDGRRSAILSVLFSVVLLLVGLIPSLAHNATPVFLPGSILLSGIMIWLSLVFLRQRTVASARKLFFWSLIYLPLILGLMLYTWKS